MVVFVRVRNTTWFGYIGKLFDEKIHNHCGYNNWFFQRPRLKLVNSLLFHFDESQTLSFITLLRTNAIIPYYATNHRQHRASEYWPICQSIVYIAHSHTRAFRPLRGVWYHYHISNYLHRFLAVLHITHLVMKININIIIRQIRIIHTPLLFVILTIHIPIGAKTSHYKGLRKFKTIDVYSVYKGNWIYVTAQWRSIHGTVSLILIPLFPHISQLHNLSNT